MNKVAAFALRRKNSILSMSEKMFCPPQPLRFWITPACAGKRGRKEVAPMSNRDHPRVCGEKRSVKALLSAVMESPPHVRGKAGHPVTRRAYRGITPAYAGKSRPQKAPHTAGRDHPRACGEKRVVAGGHVEVYRITPAYAGKRKMREWIPSACRDHPRVCGEKFHPASDRKLGRVRGTKRSSGPAPAAAPAGLAGSCPASPPWSYPPRITVSRPRP